MKKIIAGRGVKYAVAALAVAAIVYGIISGDLALVLKKAAAICLECCGIG